MLPPVQARFSARPKEKLILSVGRFSRNGTQKRQLEMVQAFARARDTYLHGWEYWCVGGVSESPVDKMYFSEVAHAAKGHPVRLIPNAPGQVVKDAYERAAVFWHGAGYGVDEHLHPEQAEHFGMSTVEAMAAGCVPVVIRKGGQREIVEHAKSGFLADTLDELVSRSHELAASPRLRETMAAAARERARVFTDLDAFADRMRALLDA
ncbi:MAG: glycosyltransferase [Vicinamibacteraceae bacterium]